MATRDPRLVPARLGALQRVAAVICLLSAGFSLAMPAILAWLLYRFQHRAEEAGPPFFISRLMVLYPVMGWLWWIRMLVSLALGGVLMAWLYATYRDLARRGGRTRYRPGWALGGFFVPLWNVVWPYLVVRDAWRTAAGLRRQPRSDAAPSTPSTPLVVKFWWGMMVITMVIGVVGGRLLMPGHMELSPVLVMWYLGGAASSALAVAMIAVVERERLDCPATRPLGLLGPWPLPLTVGISTVLATLLVLGGAYGFAALGMRQLKAEQTVGVFRMLPPEVIPPGALPPRPPSSWEVEVEFVEQSMRVRWLGVGTPDLAGYNVYRREADGTPVKINAELLTSPWFEDHDVQSGRTYSYSVASVDTGGNESPHSLEASKTAPGPGEAVGGPPDAPPPLRAVRVGGWLKEPTKLQDVRPVYPDIAKQARVQGVVILDCTISPQGKVTDVKVLRGHPLLDDAATKAVKQWRYQPTLLNGEPVPVIMTVTVNFSLQ
jgi:TonB family protein